MPRRIHGAVQHYDWGDTEFIPQLLGVPGRGEPWAELWLGTHPNGPTMLDDGTPLVAVCGPLPYLLKVLAAARPLSLQAHPTAAQAADGFARGAFGDPHAKPELLVALTTFEALCGFRPPAESVAFLRSFGADDLADIVAVAGPGQAMTQLYRGGVDRQSTIAAIDDAVGQPQLDWTKRLHDEYGDDPSVTATLLLNHVVLEPGEALHLTAGNLHAYLVGSGIELMGASDNVVRGGLTSKDVDVDLLLEVVDPTPLVQPVMVASDGRYPLPEAGVVLVRLAAGSSHTATGHELTIGLDGVSYYLAPDVTFRPTADTFVVTSL